MTLENILLIVGALVGWPALVALVIDILKAVGAVSDGTAGKWNLAFNLVGFVLVAVATGFFPEFDIPGVDAVLLEYIKIAAYVVAVVIQIINTRVAHTLYVKSDFGKKYFTFNSEETELYEINGL
jgi:hypothetical protein